ncbi:MAG: hypothetical protein KAR83_05145, partial [Thermodesulfovibrionales bacterium]|nr:hypothetical protein [Thermodesulfovibrionales bacterium]
STSPQPRISTSDKRTILLKTKSNRQRRTYGERHLLINKTAEAQGIEIFSLEGILYETYLRMDGSRTLLGSGGIKKVGKH